MLIGYLEAGLMELREEEGGERGREGEGEEGSVLERLWCALVCLQYVR